MQYHQLFVSQGMRCVQQMSLLKYWERLRKNEQLPKFNAFDPAEISRSLEKLVFFSIVPATQTKSRYRITYAGTQFEKIHARKLVGDYLEDILPADLRRSAIEQYDIVVAKKCPSFSFVSIHTEAMPIVRYERLLLPFARTEGMVEHIISVITLFTEENGFDFEEVANAELLD